MDTTEPQTQFKNDNITVLVKEEPNCMVTFEITVEPKAAAAARVQAIKNINKEVSIPGFRKGKAPANFIEQRYEKPLMDEWKEVASQVALVEACELTKTYPFNRKSRVQLDCSSLSEEGATIAATFERFPKVPEVDLDSFTITEVAPKAVTEEDLDQYIENLLRRSSKLEEVSDRPCQLGDRVVIDLELIEGKESNHHNNEQLDLPEKDPTWLQEGIVGLSIGETKEIPAPDAEDRKVIVTLRGIQKPVLPELDEELFKSLNVSGLEELRSKGREVLEKAAVSQAYDAQVAQLQAQMQEKYNFEIPLSLLVMEFRDVNMLKALEKEGLEQAKTICKQNLLCQRIADQQKIQITSDELRQAYYTQAIQASMQGIAVENEEQSQAMVDLAYRRLIADKVFGFIMEKAKKA